MKLAIPGNRSKKVVAAETGKIAGPVLHSGEPEGRAAKKVKMAGLTL